MRFSIIILLLGIINKSYGQNFKKIDQYAQNTPKAVEYDIEQLTYHLAKPAENDLEKVRSFYVWLVHNIEYDNKIYSSKTNRLNQSIEVILKKQKAICWGYSKAFQQMCSLVNIPCETVVGYSKSLPKGVGKMEEEDHAWNVVQIDEKWYVMDITWASGTLNQSDYFTQTYQTSYFLTPPELFILNHFPTDPMWQLLNCPISKEDFKKSVSHTAHLANQKDTCFHFKDSLKAYFTMPLMERGLKKAKNLYQYNPSNSNAREVVHAYLDKISQLDKIAVRYENREQYDSLQVVQQQILELYQLTEKYATLYDNEKENWARTLLNFGVGSIRQVEANPPKDNQQIIRIYQTAIQNLEKAQTILNALTDSNLFTLQALEQCNQMLDFAQYNLNIYSRQ